MSVKKSVKLPFSNTRVRADKPPQIIHTDTMGPVSNSSHPSGYKFVVIFVDDYSRAALAYPIKHKSKVPEHLKACVASMRNLIGSDNKICYLRTDQEMEFACKDPQIYREAIKSTEEENWKWAVESELNSLKDKGEFEVVKRESFLMRKAKSNILDSRWIFKRQIDEAGNVKYKASLVIRGSKDINNYDLKETYASVSRLSLVRSLNAIANKNKLHLKQLNVETALFLWRRNFQ